MKKTKLLFLAVLFFFTVNFLKAQSNLTNDYIVISTSNVETPETYTVALDAADWETFRLQNQRRELTFDNGFSLELKSAVEMLNLGYPLNIANYPLDLPPGYTPPVLHLLAGNLVGVEITPTIQGKHAE
jgi:hypothetical protein